VQKAPAFEVVLWSGPFKLFLLSFLLIFIGMIFVMVAVVLSGTSATFGAVVFVGPIPIVMGGGPHLVWAVALAVVMTILGLILFFVLRK